MVRTNKQIQKKIVRHKINIQKSAAFYIPERGNKK